MMSGPAVSDAPRGVDARRNPARDAAASWRDDGRPDDATAYRAWIAAVEGADRGCAENGASPQAGATVFSLAMVAGDTDWEAALESARSLTAQRWQGWELLLWARPRSRWTRQSAAALATAETRVRLLDPGGEWSSAAVLAGAASRARGDRIGFLLPGDVLEPETLAAAEAIFAARPEVQIVYTDEDRLGVGGRCAPWFKARFSPDAMLAGDALGALTVFRMALFRSVGGVRPETAPDHLYDLAARACRAAGDAGAVCHLPRVLCHRRRASASWPAGEAAVRRQAGQATGVEAGAWPRPRRRRPDPPPLVSVIVPTRDHAGLLAACAAGLLERTGYPAIELVIVDNDSQEPEALALLDRLRADARVRVILWPGAFNFAALNNAAAATARGDLLVLMNNDVEVLAPDWLDEMVSHAMRPDVGLVGARLLYPDRTVQHAGIVLGPHAAATHLGRRARAGDPGYGGLLAHARDVSAVTGACMAIRAGTWRAVGGMEERLAVTWNDIDLCLRVRRAGLRVIWTPHATLLHREGSTRGLESEDPARQARFERERRMIAEIWGDELDREPFLSAHLRVAEDGRVYLAAPGEPGTAGQE